MAEKWEGTSFVILSISHDAGLKEALSSIEQITLVVQRESMDPTINHNAIFLDGSLVNYKDVKYIREQCPTVPIFYKMNRVTNQTLTKNIHAVCTAYNIHTVQENLVGHQIVNEVKKVLFEEDYDEGKRVISFSGTHSGSGVSTTTLNVAKNLAEKTEEKVLVLSLNPWDPADYFIDYTGKYLDDIKVDLKTKNLTEQKLMDATTNVNGFYMLAGNRDIKLQRYFSPQEVNHLISIAKKTFDVVLIDTGTHFDNACYAQSYVESEMKFLITTQEPKGYRGYWPHIFHQLIQPIGGKSEDYMLIINQYESEMSVISEKDLAEELDMFHLVSIPDEGTLGIQAIARKDLLFNIATREYRQAISTISDSIMARAKLKLREDYDSHDRRKGIFGFVFPNKDKKVM